MAQGGEEGGMLGAVVRSWVAGTHPGEPAMARRAAMVAQEAYDGGGSVAEAWDQARALVRSWEQHPARGAWTLMAAMSRLSS